MGVEFIEEDIEIDSEAVEWIAQHITKESGRLKTLGLNPLVLQTKNFGIIRNECIINRIEIDSGFDFENRIKQILISESIDYPHKSNFNYVHVVLLTENMNYPLLVPYLFPKTIVGENGKSKKNDLKEWLLVNAKGYRARHSISEYHNM